MSLVEELSLALEELDNLKDSFKEHPMYNEWLDADESNLTECQCGSEECEECGWEENVDESAYDWLLDNL